MTPVSCAIALGSNLGDSQKTLETSLTLLEQDPKITVNARSSWYQTRPVGPPQPDYLNGCALLTVSLSPHQLMDRLLEIERQFDRVRRQKWGPRTLDLDLLLYGDLILDTPNLTIPHPWMNKRGFVLVPLVEIAPTWLDPISQQTIQHLVRQVDCSGVRRLESPDYLNSS